MDELEFVLKKIIEIDNKATDLKNSTNQIIKEKESSLNQEIKILDTELIDKSNTQLRKKHDAIIEECEQKSKMIIEESNNYIENIMKRYSVVKDELKEMLVKEIMESY